MTLDPRASRYVARVRRVRPGEKLVLFHPGEAREADATVVEIGRSGVRCQVLSVRASTLRAGRKITLLQAIGKGNKFDAIVRDATELGATEVVAVETIRGVVRLRERGEDRLRRWRRVAAEAARQCGRGDAPQITGPLPWTEALGRAADHHSVRLCPWEGASEPIGRVLRGLGAQEAIVIAVGPEGGLGEGEVASARAHGFSVVSLGPFILRTETVATAVLGSLLLLGLDPA
jgi:16S rRNA (uracil1498-N3)-methyltransferase